MKRLVLVFAILAFSLSALAGDTVTVLRVIDGDTITVWDGFKERSVRLIGVDAPESRRNAKAARDAEKWGVPLEDIIQAGLQARDYVMEVAPPGSTVTLVYDERPYDMYYRILAYVHTPYGCLNEMLVRNGYAIVYRREPFCERERYISLSDESRRHGRQFWGTLWKSIKE